MSKNMQADASVSENSEFVPTLNQMGYMTSSLDPFSLAFTEYAASLDSPALEVGAAYGIATLEALQKGATVIANDLDSRHLEILKQKAPIQQHSRLKLLLGSFPMDVALDPQSIGAALVCRVFHFFTPQTLELAVSKLYQALIPGGKLFVVCDTPYLKCFKDFLPIYLERKRSGDPWPGLILNLKDYAPGRKSTLPQMFHALDPDVLSRVLTDAGFTIEKVELFAQSKYPQDIRLDGREGVGCIAVRPY